MSRFEQIASVTAGGLTVLGLLSIVLSGGLDNWFTYVAIIALFGSVFASFCIYLRKENKKHGKRNLFG